MNDLTLWVAVYGALVATALGVWQIVAWWNDRRTRVELVVEMGAISVLSAGEIGFRIRAINHSRHPVRIISVRLEWQSAPGQISGITLASSPLLAVIDPQDNKEHFVSATQWRSYQEHARMNGLDD